MEANDIRQFSVVSELVARPGSLPEETLEPAPPVAEPAPTRVPVAAKPVWREWVETLLTTLLIFLLVESYVVQGFKVYGSCMEPNLFTGERLLGNKFAYYLQDIRRGDIIVFRPPHRPNTPFIKRVVALPGEVVEIHHSRVYINGRLLREPYLQYNWTDDRPPERVPAGKLFVLGDNRDNSSDSRAWGEVPIQNVEAKAWLRYWPLRRLEVLR